VRGKKKDETELLRSEVETVYDVQKLRVAVQLRVKNPKSWSPALEELQHRLESDEKLLGKRIAERVKHHHLWSLFLKHVKGIGPIMAAGLLSFFDIRKADHVSSFWRYAGLAPHQTRRSRGQKTDYNPKVKSFMLGRVGRQLMMARGEYHKLYDQFRAREESKHPKLSALQHHRRALRKMVKIFLEQLWVKWRQLEGLPVSQPYSVAKLGHDYIQPQPEEKKPKRKKRARES